MMNRRDLLKGSVATACGLAAWPARSFGDAGKKKVLVFTRSAGFQHDVVKLKDGTCLVHKIMQEIGPRHGFEVECTKDGRVFTPGRIEQYDAFFFYTTGDLTSDKSADGSPPMPREGKKALLDLIAAGKGFVGSHCASDTFHSPGGRRANQPAEIDPYIRMLGGEFIGHGAQQPGTMKVASPDFPGVKGIKDFTITEEWYSLKNQPKDLHVILVQETAGMKGHDYDRPRFPATWARMHNKGRVYYTSMGHRDDVWTNPMFQTMLVGALDWATGRVDADVTPNMESVTPDAGRLPPDAPPKPADKAKKK
jgi:type 1 glutamine amidotransferase